MDTIFALSSGAPPAAIAVLRISGPSSYNALKNLTDRDFSPRAPSLATLRSGNGDVLDSALIIHFPGPHSATGEDIVELHCHGGRAVLDAVSRELAAMDGLRAAEPGEFTRRAFANGRIDLAEAEGLADLLAAETELQRQSAMAMAGGALSRKTEGWRAEILALSAQLEAVLDFADEDDAAELAPDFGERASLLARELEEWLDRPGARRLREGVRIVLAGPPNAGKSTLFNALIDDEAAIVSQIAGTTRDVIERPVAIAGVPLLFIDTAGIRHSGADEIEQIGISRAQRQFERADLVLWLGPEGEGPAAAWEIQTRADDLSAAEKINPAHRVSGLSGEGVAELRMAIVRHARALMPMAGDVALNDRQRQIVSEIAASVSRVAAASDPLIAAELLRSARSSCDRLVGRTSTEDMLDALFGNFCIGK